MTETLLNGVTQTLDAALNMGIELLPKILGMLIIVAIGWVIAIVTRVVIRRLLSLVKFDALCDNVGATQIAAKADLPPPTALLSALVFWVTWTAFLMLGVSTLGIVVLQEQIAQFFRYVPQIFIAVVILFIGLLFANFAARTVLLGMVNANVPSARLLSNAVRVFLVMLAVAMALEQIALAKTVVLIAFSIAFGAVMLGLAIAFGLGGRDVARRVLERQFTEDATKSEKDEISHL
ncbi:MAG: mechanosensitive ion channel family protein [Nitrospirota bacterium]